MKRSVLIKVLVTIIILIILFYKIGTENIVDVLTKLNIWVLLLVIPLKLITLVLNALNITFLLQGIEKKISFTKTFILTNLAWSIGLFFPSRIGEFSLVFLLREHKVTYGQTTAIALLDKIITVIVLSTFSLIGIILYYNLYSAMQFSVVVLGFTVLLFIGFHHQTRHYIRKYILRKYATIFTKFGSTMKKVMKNKRIVIYNIVVTTTKWVTSFLAIKIIFHAAGVTPSLIDVTLISSIATMVSLIPISIAGIGIRESAAIYLFSQLGIAWETTLIVFVMAMVFNYVFGSVMLILNVDQVKIVRKLAKSYIQKWKKSD